MKTLSEIREHLETMEYSRLYAEYHQQASSVQQAAMDPKFARLPTFDHRIPRELLAEEILRMLAYLSVGKSEEPK